MLMMNRIASFANFPSYSGLCNSDVITLLLLNWTVTYYCCELEDVQAKRLKVQIMSCRFVLYYSAEMGRHFNCPTAVAFCLERIGKATTN